MRVNEIPLAVLMPSTKYKGLGYPTHFLKSRGSVIRNIFLNTELNNPHFLRDEIICMHCSLQIKQNLYLICMFHAPVVTQFIVKVNRKIEKSPIFESLSFFYCLHFPNVKGKSCKQ